MDKPICLCDRCGEAMHCLLDYDGKACRKNRTVEPNHADLIRAMSDEELAKFFRTVINCATCPQPLFDKCRREKRCEDIISDWLRQEAE